MWIDFVRRATGVKALVLTLALATASANLQPLPAEAKKQDPDATTQLPYDVDEPALTPSVYANAEPDEDEPLKPGTLDYAKAQVRGKDFKGALTTYKTLFMTSPYDADVLLGIAYCADRLGDLDEAIKYARQASQADPDSPETHVALAHYLEENRDLRAAYLQYSRAMDLKPSTELMQQIFAPTLRILMSMNDTAVAIRLAHKWAHDYSKDPDCQYNNGWVLSQCGDDTKKLNEAVSSYRLAINLDPGLVGAHYNLALLHLKMNQTDGAIVELGQFIKLAPKDPDCKQARLLLAKLKGQSAAPVSVAPQAVGPAMQILRKTAEPKVGEHAKELSLTRANVVPASSPKKLAAKEPAEVKSAIPAPEPVAKADAVQADSAAAAKAPVKKMSRWDELHSKQSFNR